jgi:CcmD family protein
MMKRLAGFFGVVLMGVMCIAPPAWAQQPPTEPQTEFLPIDELPPAEQLPAAPLLVAAYAFAWLVVFFYVWTVWRRLNRVENEMQTLEKRLTHRGEPSSSRTSVR